MYRYSVYPTKTLQMKCTYMLRTMTANCRNNGSALCIQRLYIANTIFTHCVCNLWTLHRHCVYIICIHIVHTMYIHCICNVYMWFPQRIDIVQTMYIQWVSNVHTFYLHRTYCLYHVQTLFIQYIVCTMHKHCIRNAYTLHMQCIYKVHMPCIDIVYTMHYNVYIMCTHCINSLVCTFCIERV